MESHRPDRLIKDEKAIAAVARLGHYLERIRRFPTNGDVVASTVRRSLEFDRRARCPVLPFACGQADHH